MKTHPAADRSVRFTTALPAVSRFCLGTIYWGTQCQGNSLQRLYEAFRSAGGNFFDSAHIYASWMPDGQGSSERALAQIVRQNGDRKNVVIATKGGHPPVKDWYPHDADYLSPQAIASDVGQSLERLGESSIDLYYLHRDDLRVPVDEIIDALNVHLSAGQIKAIGASNWTAQRLSQANDYAKAHGKAGFVVSQPKFSLAVGNPSSDPTARQLDAQDAGWYTQHHFPVCAYSPTANGFFATNGVKGEKGWNNPTTAARLAAANRVAAEIGASANQVALAWLLHQDFPVIPVLGTTDVAHLNDALAAGKITLGADHLEQLSVA